MVMMLRQCCCGCTLKTGTIIIGGLCIVSANFPSNLIAAYRNGSSLSQEQRKLKLRKLQFTRVAKVLAISIQITFEQSAAIPAHCLKGPRYETWMSKGIQLHFCTHHSRCEQDFGACGRREVFVFCDSHYSK